MDTVQSLINITLPQPEIEAPAKLEYDRTRILSIAAVVFLGYLLLRPLFDKRLPLPPAPTRLPLLGNLHQFPASNLWGTYKKWHNQYGPIMGLKYGQRTVISLGSHEVAKDLLEKRSNIYSSRPNFVVAKAFSNDANSALIAYDERWKTHHSLLSTFMNARMAAKYQFLQNIESKQALHDLMSVQGTEWMQVFHRYTISVTFTLAYGERIPELYDERILFIDELTETISSNVEKPKNLIADCFPTISILPSALMRWKKQGKVYHDSAMKFFLDNHAKALQKPGWNWVKESQTSEDANKLDREEVIYLIGVLIEAGGSTMKTFEFFVMASILFPEKVRLVQEEVDRVVGADRLPTWDDSPNLPYLHAFIREVQRWRPIFPFGVPHSNLKEDVYNGFRIPKDSVVLANHWAMDSDHKVFENADDFVPERWLEDSKLPFLAFGYGKRVCPGQHIAKRSLFIIISRTLWAYNITHAYEKGKKVEIDPHAIVQNILAGPVPFKGTFTPRDADRYRILEEEFSNIGQDEANIWDVCKP
uniref:Cytochrome P450 monooxygenase peniB n=1 Tax=Penicillium patulum TaxID=5078 RepID=PENIB_PENPA|nr:PeniB [Penicillium griseofulvum]